MSPSIRIVWHFGGLAAMLTGVGLIWGWPAVLFAAGLWALLGTAFDALADLLQ